MMKHSLQLGAFKTQNTGSSHSRRTQRRTLTGSGRTEATFKSRGRGRGRGRGRSSRGSRSSSSSTTSTSRQDRMLLATFKLCAGSSYQHVRNMKGEFPGEEGVRSGDQKLSSMWFGGKGTGLGASHSGSDPSHTSYWASLHNSCPFWPSIFPPEPLG